MTQDFRREMDSELKKDLNDIISKVEEFAEEKDSIFLSLLRQKRLPELFETCNN